MQRLRTPVKLRNAILYAEDKTDGAVVLFEEQAVDQAAVAVEQGRAKYTTPAAYLCGWAARALPIVYQRSRENLTFAVVQPFGIVIRTYCPPLPAVVALS